MQRRPLLCLAFIALALVSSSAPQKQNVASSAEIETLQQKRIGFLEERVAQIESVLKVGLVDRGDLVGPRMDLINAQIEYAKSNAERRRLLTELIAEYDAQIQIAEADLRAPTAGPQGGKRNTYRLASSDLLFLKSERIRIQISRDILN